MNILSIFIFGDIAHLLRYTVEHSIRIIIKRVLHMCTRAEQYHDITI